MSTAFHPQTDGQTERVNQSLNQYLRVYTSYLQDDWVPLLPTAEFLYNNSVHLSTGVTPFFANAAFHPRGIDDTAIRLSDKPNELATYLSEMSQFLVENLTCAADDMKRFADAGRREAPRYVAGDKVLISTKNISTPRPKPKWSDKWIGPYEVLKEAYPNSDAYVLDLPKAVKLHPVFHTSLLIPYCESTIPERVQPPPPPVVIEDEDKYEIEQILKCQWRFGRLKYFVRWKGYSPKFDSWMDHEGMDNCQQLVDEFHNSYPIPPRPKKSKSK